MSARASTIVGRRLLTALTVHIAPVTLALVLAWPAVAVAAEPVVAVWYRGVPAGVPRQSDLGAIRALGFNGIVWPRGQAARLDELQKLAAAVGLKVVIAEAPVALTPDAALTPPDRVDIVITPATAGLVTALSWRAVAHGARTLAYDGGAAAGAGLEEPDGSLRPWVRLAIGMARQLTANARLADVMRKGPGVVISPVRIEGLDVVLLDADRSWVIVATNTSAAPVRATVRLPAGAPYAIWVSWLDGTPLAMAGEAAGPRWELQLEARAARVYIIDKVMK